MPHPATTDPRIIAANALIGAFRIASSSSDWAALRDELDQWDPQELCTGLAFACDKRAREAAAERVVESSEMSLETER